MRCITYNRVKLASLVYVAGLTACDSDRPTRPDILLSLTGRAGSDLNAEWARVAAEEAPGFAGYYVDDAGATVIMLVDVNRRAAAERYVALEMARNQHPFGRTEIRQARYDFAQLNAWHDEVGPLFDNHDVYWLDIDEVRNQLQFGVANEATRLVVKSEAIALGVPEAALSVDVSPKLEYRLTLRERVRPVRAGFQITEPTNGWTCTLTVNGLVNGVSSFITASHCSAEKYVLDGGNQHQANLSDEVVGTETHDRSPSFCCGTDCRRGCRHADASIYGYVSGIESEFGYITRTTSPPGYGASGSITVDDANPRWSIAQKNNGGVVGIWINKVGRTSGWTRGRVTRSCVRLSSLWCQYVAWLWSLPGDSGSPIFQDSGDSIPSGVEVNLRGILWGGPTGVWDTTWYSGMTNGIEKDFGTVFVCLGGGC